MKKIIKYIALLPAVWILAPACQKESPAPDKDDTGTVKIQVKASLPEVKSVSVTELGVDLIYLYAIDESGNIIATAQPDSYSGNTYNYTVPTDTYFMVFSNSTSYSSGSDDAIISFIPMYADPGLTQDTVTGSCYFSEIDENGNLSLHLSRRTAKLTADIQILDYNGNPTDVFQSMIYAGIDFQPMYGEYVYKTDFSQTYSGEIAGGATGPATAESAMSYRVCNDITFYPSVDGTTPSIHIFIQCYNNQWYEFNTTLGYPFEANKHYKLTINVKMGRDGFGFTIDDIITEEITVDLN